VHETPARVHSQAELATGLTGTIAAWQAWSKLHQGCEGSWRDLVHRSGLVQYRPGQRSLGDRPSRTLRGPRTGLTAKRPQNEVR